MNFCNNCGYNKKLIKEKGKKCKFWEPDGICLFGKRSDGTYVIEKIKKRQ